MHQCRCTLLTLVATVIISSTFTFTSSTITTTATTGNHHPLQKVIKEHPFKHLLRWAASPETFTLDFGTYEDEYVVVVTNEGDAISALIGGYIDLLLKKQKGSTRILLPNNRFSRLK